MASADPGSCDSILDLHPEHLLFGENSVSSSRNDPSEPDFEGELPMKVRIDDSHCTKVAATRCVGGNGLRNAARMKVILLVSGEGTAW